MLIGQSPAASTLRRRVNVEFPTWFVAGLDRQAQKLGSTRQALIKMWIAERLQ
jgi:hypothetical protein